MEEKNNQKQNGNFKNKNYRKRGRSKPQKAEYNPPYPKDVLDQPISYLELGEATSSVLLAGGVDTVGKIVVRTSKEMYGVQRFNKKNLFELTSCLKAKCLDFRPSPENRPENKPANAENKVNENKKDGRDNRKQKDAKDKKTPNLKEELKKPQKALEQNREKDKQSQKSQKGNELDYSSDYKEIPIDKKSKNAAFDVYKIFPRKPFVPSAPVPVKKDRFTKFQKGGKWGFKNTQTGKEVIPPIYDEVFEFKDDYACVERNQAFGYINRENELVIPYKYDCASSFSEGLACVAIGEKCGYINKSGEVVIPFVYDAGTAFVDKTCRVKQNGKWGTYSLETKSVDWTN